MIISLWRSFFLLGVLKMGNTRDGLGALAQDENIGGDGDDECGLYLAVSSTSTVEEPRWGLYAGKTIPQYAPIGYGEVAIQLHNLLANSLTVDDVVADEDYVNELADIVEFLEGYIWVPQSSGGQFELADGGRITTGIPGVGVLSGFNEKLTNADWNHSKAYHRPAWGETPGLSHPGRGASSHFFETSITAREEIRKGMEIFINYGSNWEGGDEEEENDSKITKDDHKKIDETIEKMIAFFDKYKDDLDDKSKRDIYQFLSQDVMAAAAGNKKAQIIATMLPDDPDKLPEVLEHGGAVRLSAPGAVRSIKWLSHHGRCMDNLRPGPSAIPHAGRGAFATRPIASGGLVSPVPLVQIAHEDIFEMYPLEEHADEEDEPYHIRAENATEPIGTQLLINYCFGHPESHMMFFPSGGATSFINHSPEPNAKLVWSNHPNQHKHWFDLEPEDLIKEGNSHLGLLMEVVATKDIAKGEEVTIDYGPEWAEAWKAHLENWENGQKEGYIPKTWPLRALDLNDEYSNKPFEVDAKYPENVIVKCFLMVKKSGGKLPNNNEKGEKIRVWADTGKTLDSDHLFDCSVVDSQETTNDHGKTTWLYTIKWQGKKDITWVHDVPHRAIVFVDKPGTSDQHFTQAFRHYIGIPDEIFPQGPWRNVGAEDYEEEEEEDEDYGEEEEEDEDDEEETEGEL